MSAGNASFKVGKFADAVGHYSAAIFMDRTDPTLPLNRAAAYLKLGKNEDAERDCSTVLGLPLGKDNVKALFRRYQARMALGKKGDAEQDLQEALRIEPQNEAVKKEFQQFRSLAEAPAPALNSSSTSTKPYRRRVPIAIVEGAESSSLSATAAPSTNVPNPSEPQSLMNAISSRPIKTSESADSATARTTPTAPDSLSKLRDPKTETREMNGHKVGGGIFRYKGQRDSSPSNPSQTPKTVASSSATNPSERTRASETSSKRLTLSPSQTGQPKAPATLYDFGRLWNTEPSAEGKWQLINLIPPNQLPKLFLTSLEPGLVMDMVRTFDDVLSSSSSHGSSSAGGSLSPEVQALSLEDSTQNVVMEYMAALPTVPRFEFVRLFLSDTEKATIRKVVQRLPDAGEMAALWGV
ncbi:hypothetical protein FRC05_001395 [Tulasnella sp. 425]|nr:hypothetical protein FRC05_001395 [Tulasnella sp. 425]